MTDELGRDSMLFYRSYKAAMELLPEDKQLDFLKSIIDYGLDGKQFDAGDDEVIRMAYTLIQPLLDANIKNYINGKKGGAPRGNQNARKQPKNNPKTTQKQGNDNVNVNVNANANDNDNNINIINNVNNSNSSLSPHLEGGEAPNSENGYMSVEELKKMIEGGAD